MDAIQVAKDMNTLAKWLGKRDVPELSTHALQERYGFEQVDVYALFGGAPLVGADVMAQAMRAGVARHYALVGGVGHTTAAFRASVRSLCLDVDFEDDASEAEVFDRYLQTRYGLAADILEKHSTNCGNNVTYLRDLLSKYGIHCQTMLLTHDPTMQTRIAAEVEQEMPTVENRINFAAYEVRVVPVALRGKDATEPESIDGLGFDHTPLGMWTMRHYLKLLMGEIPRLTDDEHGYGPRGAGFLPHIDVPEEVTCAWKRLLAVFPDSVRIALS